jgi:hypothetical protein
MEIVRHLLGNFKPAQRYLFRHDIDLKKRVSENTLNGALKRMGYRDLLTGHGIRATISTALNEIGYRVKPAVKVTSPEMTALGRPTVRNQRGQARIKFR